MKNSRYGRLLGTLAVTLLIIVGIAIGLGMARVVTGPGAIASAAFGLTVVCGLLLLRLFKS